MIEGRSSYLAWKMDTENKHPRVEGTEYRLAECIDYLCIRRIYYKNE